MSSIDVYAIKSKTAEILRTFRDLLTVSELKINKMSISNNEIIVEGEYKSKALFTSEIIEEGTFKIIFDKQLNPKNVSIMPSPKG